MDEAATIADANDDPDFHGSDRQNYFENEAAVDWACAATPACCCIARLLI